MKQVQLRLGSMTVVLAGCAQVFDVILEPEGVSVILTEDELRLDTEVSHDVEGFDPLDM